jgi:Tfp pilus assembly protein PilF
VIGIKERMTCMRSEEDRAPIAAAAYARGLAAWETGDLDSARECLERALGLLPDHVEIAYNLGVLLRETGRLGDAAAIWQALVRRDPAQPDAWLNLGAVTETMAGEEAARAVYARALEVLPDDPPLLFNAADLQYRLGDLDGSLAISGRLLRVDPGRAPAWVNAGMALKRKGQWDLAEQFYRQAIALADPSCLGAAWFNLAHLLLAQERWAEGWEAHEWRRQIPGSPQPDWGLPPWTGSEPPGTRVLLWCDQGYGDTIQYLRYAPVIAARGHRVLLHTNDLLVRLCTGVEGVAAVSGLSEPPPAADCHLAIGSLPLIAGGGAPVWPGPYLPRPLARPLPSTDARLRVGLVWAGNPAHVNDAARSRPLTEFAPLFDVPDVSWFSLQTGTAAAALASSPEAAAVTDLARGLGDFEDTASFMLALDLVVAVDTAAIHLAGALGVPAWLVLPPVETDWRWGLSGEATAWYPSLRVFRAEGHGGIEASIGRMAAMLREWAAR